MQGFNASPDGNKGKCDRLPVGAGRLGSPIAPSADRVTPVSGRPDRPFGGDRVDPPARGHRWVTSGNRRRKASTQRGYSGVLGGDSSGAAGGRMPPSAPVGSGVKATGKRMPTSAPVSVSCFST
jgi:hypothetical protein